MRAAGRHACGLSIGSESLPSGRQPPDTRLGASVACLAGRRSGAGTWCSVARIGSSEPARATRSTGSRPAERQDGTSGHRPDACLRVARRLRMGPLADPERGFVASLSWRVSAGGWGLGVRLRGLRASMRRALRAVARRRRVCGGSSLQTCRRRPRCLRAPGPAGGLSGYPMERGEGQPKGVQLELWKDL
jgi:hypothetical protein